MTRFGKAVFLFPAIFFAAAFTPLAAAESDAPLDPVADAPFRQATSVKYVNNKNVGDARFLKLAVDYRDNVFVLTDKGVYRNFSGKEFGGDILAKDFSYASLSDKIPVDITIQEGTGYLYYLYGDRYLTNAHAGTIYGKFPDGAYSTIRVNDRDEILLLGAETGALYRGREKVSDIDPPPAETLRTLAAGGDFLALTPEKLLRLDGTAWTTVLTGEKMTCAAVSNDMISIGTENGVMTVNRSGETVEPLTDRVPIPAVTGAAFAETSRWYASDRGAFVAEPDRWRYFAGPRWLNSDKILDIAADSKGNVFLLTDAGLNEIRYIEQTLADKAAAIQEDIEKYHNRFGWSSAASLVDPNDPTTLSLRDSDNDGLWTSIYLGSQVFRYAVTSDESARRNIWESFEAFERNVAIHGLDGFSSRTFERKGYIESDPKAWRDAPEEDWVWKGTTSTDEVVGYIFVTDLIDRLVAKTPEEKKRVADYYDAILSHIVRNDYYMIDYDGRPTLWARWNAEYVNRFDKTLFDRKLNSTLITAMLQLGYRLTGKTLYRDETFRLWKEWGYWDNMTTPMSNIRYSEGFQHCGNALGIEWNHSDDEMAFLTYHVLLNSMIDAEVRPDYERIVGEHWEIERPEKNALWNVISYACCGKIDRDAAIWWLREFNLDRRDWKAVNSHRNDLTYRSREYKDNFRMQMSDELLTQGELRMMRHNANGFTLDGGENGARILTGEEFLLPYWMCRYYGVLK